MQMPRRIPFAAGALAIVAAFVFSRQETPRASPPLLMAMLVTNAPAPHAAAGDSNAEVTASDPVVPLTSARDALTPFREWTRRWLAAGTADRRGALAVEGVALARARRAEFLKLIEDEPERALAEAVPLLVRQELPAEVLAFIEERVNARGALTTYMSRPGAADTQPGALRHAVLEDGRVFRVMATGADRSQVLPVANRSLIGVALAANDGAKPLLALSTRRANPLPVGFRVPPSTPVIAVCPVSGRVSAGSADDAQSITEQTPAVEANGAVVYLCDGSHTRVFEENLIQGEGATGGPQPLSGALPHGSVKSRGMLKVLYIPMTFQDQNATPASEATCYSVMNQVADFYSASSYGKLTILATVAPPVMVPHSEAWYVAKDLSVDGLGLEHTDARAEARKAGYDSAAFDVTVVRLNGGPRATGGWGGGGSVWTYSDDPGIVAHEIGHTLGLSHANFWDTGGVSTIGSGVSQEYGDPYDVMGRGGFPAGQFNILAKTNVGWLTNEHIITIAESGTYRIFAHDANTLEPARRYGLKIAKDNARTYYIETRQLRDANANEAWLRNGAIIEWSWPARHGANNLLLDTTPGSPGGKSDGVLTLGRTFSDREAGLHFTPMAVNVGAQKSVDVVVNVGQFPGDQAPELVLVASALNVSAGATVTFTATASDPDGDTLAYFWDFGDGSVSANAAVMERQFASAGRFTVECTASDMKGRTTTRFVVVNVGAPSTFTISGRVTLGGQPLTDIPVSDGTTETRTDADGNYALGNLATGPHTLAPRLEGYTFASNVAQPVMLAASVSGVDFAATGGVFVMLAATVPTCAEGDATPGRFTLTRSGDTTAALTVFVEAISGTATIASDYSLTPNVSANTFTIPPGAASLDILVTPVDDAATEGPETVTMQLVPDAAYVIGGIGEATVMIEDNDTPLPKVSIIATKAMTVEGDEQGAEFTVTRTGATGSALTVSYAVSGTATAGTDFVALPGFITIPANAASAMIPLTTIDDTVSESNETVTVTLSNSANYIIGTGAATATIVDDDVQIITLTTPDAVATETPGAPDTASFLVSRSGDTAEALTIYYALTGTALHGVDYEVLPGYVTISAGQTSAAITIVPIADGLGEGPETVTLQLASLGTNYKIAVPGAGTITINDAPGDKPYVEVIAYDGFCAEPANAGTFRFTAKGGSGAFTVSYTVSGTAPAGIDYVALSGSITIPAGNTRTADVVVTPIDDALLEDLETITIAITPGANYQTWSASSAATMWLRDDDQPTVFVDAGGTQPTESGTPGSFFISRTGGTIGALIVNYTMSGSATNGADYEMLSGVATIPEGASGVDVEIIPIQDTLAEGTETITMTLAPGRYSRSPLSPTLYMADDDANATTVQFASAAGAGVESIGTVNIPVTLNAASAGTVTVEYGVASADTTTAASAVPGFSLPYWVRLVRTGDTISAFRSADGAMWTPHGAPVLMPLGGLALVGLVVCSANDGTLATGVFDHVSIPGGSGALVSRDIGGVAAGGSVSDAPGTLTVKGSGANVSGGSDEFQFYFGTLAGDSTITARVVSLTNTSSAAKAGVMIRESVDANARHVFMEMHPGGSAELLWRASAVNSALGDGVDYDTPAGTLTFPPGVTTQNIPLTIRDDALRESGERIVIRLKNASGAALGTPAAFTFSIGDNDGMPNIEQWRVAHFGANAGGNPDAADLADPDGDGLANLLEYALGLDPLAAGSSGVTTDFEAIGAAQYLRMTVSKNPSATDVTFRIESSDSPAAANWSASGTTIELDNATTLRARDNTPSGAAPQRYLHLKITRNLVP